jgi:hypothetical protein
MAQGRKRLKTKQSLGAQEKRDLISDELSDVPSDIFSDSDTDSEEDNKKRILATESETRQNTYFWTV